MKNKLRKIVVSNREFFWTFKDKLLRASKDKTFTSQSILTIFPVENKKSVITVTFETWHNLYTGNPLKTGVTADFSGVTINLHYPGIVGKIIDYLMTNKIWAGDNLKPASIDGMKILAELGYEIEKLKPLED